MMSMTTMKETCTSPSCAILGGAACGLGLQGVGFIDTITGASSLDIELAIVRNCYWKVFEENTGETDVIKFIWCNTRIES